MRKATLLVVAVLLAGCGADDGTEGDAPTPRAVEWVGNAGWQPSDARLNDPAALFPGAQKVQYETSVAIDPTDPDTMLAFGIDLSTQNFDSGMYSTNRLFRSADGGLTWDDHGAMRYSEEGAVWGGGDPVVAFAQDGTAYFASLAGNPDGTEGGIWVHRSMDGGATWDLPVLAVAGHETGEGSCTGTDKEWLEVDRWTGALYIAFTLFTYDCQGPPIDPIGAGSVTRMKEIGIHFTRSDDGGRTWSAPTLVHDGYALGAIPRAGPDGTLHIAFWSTSLVTPNLCPTIAGPLAVAAGGAPFHSVTVGRSVDGGKNWALETLEACVFDLAETTKGGRVVGGNFLGSLTVDPTDGRAFLAYPYYVAALDRFEVRLVASPAAGSWSAAVTVPTGAGDARMPTIVARHGILHVTYLASTGDTGGISYLQSNDGGRSWSEPITLNSQPFQLGDDPEVGDYTGLDVEGGRIVATWTDARAGTQTEIWGRGGVLAT